MNRLLLATAMLAIGAVAVFAAPQAAAQAAFPSRPVKLIVPQPPGGGFDLVALYRNLPYDSLRDFEPLGLAVSYSYTLMARKDLPFHTLKDVVAYADVQRWTRLIRQAGIQAE